MKPEEIKIGGVYDVRVKVMKKFPADSLGKLEIGAYTVDRATNLPMEYEMSWFFTEEAPAFAEINSENDRKNSEPAPKYDPCRLFKKGDRVRVVAYKGRIKPYLKDVLGKIYTLDGGEDDIHVAYIKADCIDLVDVCHLELVTPVEEIDRYCIVHNEREKFFDVSWKDDDEPDGMTGRTRCLATYWYNKPPQTYTQKEARAAAEAECKRLNEEYRKEQKNG